MGRTTELKMFGHYLRSKGRPSVGNDIGRDAVALYNLIHEEFGNLKGCTTS